MRTSFLRIAPPQVAAAMAGLAVFIAATTGPSAQNKQNEIVTEQGLKGIEGPAVDAEGTLYFVAHISKAGAKVGRIHQLKPGAKKSEVFAELTGGSIGNGIRFDKDGRMYVADFPNHNVLVFEKNQTTAEVYFTTRNAKDGAPKFNQPNDLAMGNDGTLYASDPLRKGNVKTGQIWRITRDAKGRAQGAIMTSNRKQMGVTNGIDVSPDGKTLYVGESTTGQVWAYRIDGNKLVAREPLAPLAVLSGGEIDGLRTDSSGQIYVTHNGGQKISVLTSQGKQAREPIPTNGAGPSNLTFGGPDGKTVYVTQTDGGFVESFTVDTPGREPCPQQKSATVCAAP